LFSARIGNDLSLWTFSLQDKKAEMFGAVQTASDFLTKAMFSPDGRWIAYGLRELSGVAHLYVQPFPATGAKYQISSTGESPVWSPDGSQLFYVAGERLVVVSVTVQPTFTFGNPVTMPGGGLRFSAGLIVPRRFDIGPDGGVIGVVDSVQAPSSATVVPRIEVVINWFEQLKARVPTK
jgi:Tol biopolymer transport system component